MQLLRIIVQAPFKFVSSALQIICREHNRTCSSHPTKAKYGGPRYRCKCAMKRPSRESLGTTLVSVVKLLAESQSVVFFALSTWSGLTCGFYRPVRTHSGRNPAMLPAPTTVKVNKNFRSQRYLGAWYTLWQVLWKFGEISLFIYKLISFFLIKCANHWDKRTFCSTSCWLASNINRWRQPYRQNFFVFIPVKFLRLLRLFRI